MHEFAISKGFYTVRMDIAYGPSIHTPQSDASLIIQPIDYGRTGFGWVPERTPARNLLIRISLSVMVYTAFGSSLATAAIPIETPAMPRATLVPSSGSLPLSSAYRAGTEYADLERAGYAEEEYYLSGIAPAITAAGEVLEHSPYITRFLVRKPKNPARFNGTVIIEPFSWFGERAAGWILTRDYLLRRGYAFVGYTLNINRPAEDPKFPPTPDNPELQQKDIRQYGDIVNFDFMRRFDYARYAPLGSYYDDKRFLRGGSPDPFVPQSQAIGAQLALLLKSNLADGPTTGLRVERVYVNSWAVTAQVWMDYLDQGRHQQWRMPDGRPLIDAYMTGKMSFGEVGGDVVRVPRRMPDDAPFVVVYSQSETVHDAIEGIALPPDTDSPRLRYYEVMGTPHLRAADLGTGEIEPWPNEGGKPNDPRCQFIYDEPSELPFSALLDAMDRWVREGTPMPKARRVERQGKGVVRDARTSAIKGGVQPPWAAIPSAEYWTDFETGCGVIYDSKRPFSAKRLRELYGSYERYKRLYDGAKRSAVAERFLLPEDAAKLDPIASPTDFIRDVPLPRREQ